MLRIAFAFACSAALLFGCPTARVCEAGRVVSCPCALGGMGVQTCSESGTGFGACVGCVDRPDGALPDGGAFDGSLSDAASDVGPQDDTGVACDYPELRPSTMPTSGTCDGNTAVDCDRRTRRPTRVDCAATEHCALVRVEQLAVPGAAPPIPAATYDWAVCVPNGAASCSYSPGDGTWSVDDLPRCAGTTASEACTTGLPSDLPENAGSRTAFYRTVACAGGGHCRNQRCVLSDSPCTEERWTCVGNDLAGCGVGDLPTQTTCSGSTECRSTSACTPGTTSASCIPAAALAGATCDPATFSTTCGPTGGELVCDPRLSACWGDVTCACEPYETACLAPGESCQSFVDPGTGMTAFGCRSSVSCVGGSRCEGDSAIRCDATGNASVTDCSAHGMACATAAGVVGCALGAATCSSVVPSTCASPSQVAGCCGAGDYFDSGATMIPCLPGRAVQAVCPTGMPPAPTYVCFSGRCTAI